jgi:hypothetical protein
MSGKDVLIRQKIFIPPAKPFKNKYNDNKLIQFSLVCIKMFST